MKCQEVENMVLPYIRHQLTDYELEKFIQHIEGCESCKEELEIYFMVNEGLKQLDSGTGAYNIKEALETAIEQSKIYIQGKRIFMIFRYAVDTLCIMGILITVLLQLRIWWQAGFLNF